MADQEPLVLTLRDSADHRRMPPLIALCFGIDVALAGMYLLVILMPYVSWKLFDMFHLEHESNLPTWYSSLQLLLVGALFALFARVRFDRRHPRSWVLLALPVMFIVLSIDEATQFHEWLGTKLDQILLPTGDRADTMLPFTGIWVIVLGIPVLLMFVGLIRYARAFFAARPEAASKMITGVLLLLAGAVGVESLANFLPVQSAAHDLEVFLEELLEMVGVTVILWGVVDLLHAHGLSVRIWPNPVSDRPFPTEAPLKPPPAAR